MSPINTDSAAGVEGAVFDFVVVGGGTSGLVVANRLTEDPDVQVLVLEAGTNRLNDPRLMVPGLGIAVFEDPNFDWNFRSSPQVSLHFAVTRQRPALIALCTAIGATQWPPDAHTPGTNVGRFVGYQYGYGGLPLKGRY